MSIQGQVRGALEGRRPLGRADEAKPAAAPGEVSQAPEVEKVAEALPAVSDGFAAPSPEQSAPVEVTAPPRPVESLVPDLEMVQTLPEVVTRFEADFLLLRDQLLGLPGQTGGQKADRLFTFFAEYAKRFVEISNGRASAPPEAQLMGEALPLPRGVQVIEIKRFLDVLQRVGFHRLLEVTSGKDGVAVAREVLVALSAKDLVRTIEAREFAAPALDAPALQAPAAPHVRPFPVPASPQPRRDAQPSRERGDERRASTAAVATAATASNRRSKEPDIVAVERGQPSARVSAQVVDPARVPIEPPSRRGQAEETRRSSRGTDKVLGRNMFWNVLHRYRKGANEDPTPLEREGLDRLLFTAGLVLLGGALLVVVLVSL